MIKGRMKLKQLESLLQDVQGFQNPQQELEQYITQPRLAAAVTYAVRRGCQGSAMRGVMIGGLYG